MAVGSFSENCQMLNEILLGQLNFFDSGPVEKNIFYHSDPASLKVLADRIQVGKINLPAYHQEGYIDPLLKNLGDIIDALSPVNDPPDPDDKKHYGYLTLLINAAVQPGEKDVMPHLFAVQRIVDDMYNRFLRSRINLGISRRLAHPIPPLVGFVGPLDRRISTRAPMPSAFEVEQMRDPFYWLGDLAKGFKAGAVTIPAGYWNVPLLWGVLGHEVGGHYTLSADRGSNLLRDLKLKVYEKMKEKYPKEVALLWLYWATEAAADVCGVLNLGPSFGIGAISFYTAQLSLGKWPYGRRKLKSVYEPNNDHPTQVLVPYVISGAVEALRSLGESRKLRYMAQLDEIARWFSHGVDEITFPDRPTLLNRGSRKIKLPAKQPMKIMRESARIAGQYIATAKLKAINGHDLQDFVTWGDEEEDIALEIAAQIRDKPLASEISIKGKKPTGLQLLSGGILAVIREPGMYAQANDALRRQLGINTRFW